MAVVAFTGTDTGKVYVVGQAYQSNPTPMNPTGIKIAQSDGSFKPLSGQGNSGGVGSSQSSTATFYVTGDSLSVGGGGSKSGSGPGTSAVQTVAGKSVVAATKSVGTGPGVAAAGNTGSGAFAGLFAAAGYPEGSMFVQNKDGTFDASKVLYPVGDNLYLQTTAIWVGGELMPMKSNTSDVQDMQSRFGDDNPIISTVGAGVVGATSGAATWDALSERMRAAQEGVSPGMTKGEWAYWGPSKSEVKVVDGYWGNKNTVPKGGGW